MVVDAATLAVTATVDVGLSPTAVVVSPDGSTVYVANADSDSISAVRLVAPAPADAGTAELADTGLDAGSTAAGLGLIAMGMLALVVHCVARARQRTENPCADELGASLPRQAEAGCSRRSAARIVSSTPGARAFRSSLRSELRIAVPW
ncbi:YncE family protein [Homoserinibacter gongjuensis]